MRNSILAGILIGIGDIALIQSDNKIIGAFLFSVALLSIIKLQLPLYTGRIGFFPGKYTVIDLARMLVGNIVGVTGAVLFWAWFNYDAFCMATDAKSQPGYVELLLSGFFCGVLIHIAVCCKDNLVTVLCIMVFILSGHRHCIADFPFMANGKWIMVLIGNTVGAIVTEQLRRHE